jgi:peroxiredoxin/Tfp pilus assembly protein PilF
MRHCSRLLVMLVLSAGAVPAAQGQSGNYEEELRSGDAYLQRREYDQALRYYKSAYGLKDKSSYDAVVGMAEAYNGLGSYKNALEMCSQGLKLAGADARRQARMHNLRGVALVGLSGKPGDRKFQEAESEFRTALAADDSLPAARLNLGIALLRMHRDDDGLRELKAYVESAPKGADVENARRMIEDPRRAREAFAPAFSFTSSEGEHVDLDGLRGKTVLIDFWGSWCVPCVQSTPGLVKLRRKFAGQPVVFLGIAQDQENSWRRFLEKSGMDWPQYLDSSHQILRSYGVNTFPTYVVVDGEGIVRARKSGYGPGQESWLEREIKNTLKDR